MITCATLVKRLSFLIYKMGTSINYTYINIFLKRLHLEDSKQLKNISWLFCIAELT